jgi:general secretion pathway protein G
MPESDIITANDADVSPSRTPPASSVARQSSFPHLPTAAAIISVLLAGLALFSQLAHATDRVNDAKRKFAATQIHTLLTALDMYFLDNGFYPTSDQGLQALVQAPSTPPVPKNYPPNGYVTRVPRDPWKNEFIYRCPGLDGGPYSVQSYGADGKPGGKDQDADINSWELPRQ